MKRISLIVLLLCLLSACGKPGEPRRDLILIIAGSPPESAAPRFEALGQAALVFNGGLRRAESRLAEPTGMGLRIELATSRHDGDWQHKIYPRLVNLPTAARLSGRNAMGFSVEAGISPDAGFDQFLSRERAGGLQVTEATTDFAPAMDAAIEAIEARAAKQAHERGRLFVMCDLADELDCGPSLESILQAFDRRGLTANADIAIYFTAPSASTRLVLAGPTIAQGLRTEAVDPRDIFPTIARLARIPIPGILQGIDLLQSAD